MLVHTHTYTYTNCYGVMVMSLYFLITQHKAFPPLPSSKKYLYSPIILLFRERIEDSPLILFDSHRSSMIVSIRTFTQQAKISQNNSQPKCHFLGRVSNSLFSIYFLYRKNIFLFFNNLTKRIFHEKNKNFLLINPLV